MVNPVLIQLMGNLFLELKLILKYEKFSNCCQKTETRQDKGKELSSMEFC